MQEMKVANATNLLNAKSIFSHFCKATCHRSLALSSFIFIVKALLVVAPLVFIYFQSNVTLAVAFQREGCSKSTLGEMEL